MTKTRASSTALLDRLAQLPLRFGKLKHETALHAAIVSEAARLLGAQRVLLVLQPDDAAPRIAGSRLPAGERAPRICCRPSTPWLAEALDTGASRLRHGPDGAEPIDQRSCLVAPLVAPHGPLGCLYADIEGAQGRFEDTERALLATAGRTGRGGTGAWHEAPPRCSKQLARRTAEAHRHRGRAEGHRGRAADHRQFDRPTPGRCSTRSWTAASGCFPALPVSCSWSTTRAWWRWNASTGQRRDAPSCGDAAVTALEAGLRSVYPMPLADTALPAVFETGDVVDFRDVLNDPGAPQVAAARCAAAGHELLGADRPIAVARPWHRHHRHHRGTSPPPTATHKASAPPNMRC